MGTEWWEAGTANGIGVHSGGGDGRGRGLKAVAPDKAQENKPAGKTSGRSGYSSVCYSGVILVLFFCKSMEKKGKKWMG